MLGANTGKARMFTYPIKVFSRHLRELGLMVEIIMDGEEPTNKCDVMCFLGQDTPQGNTNSLESIDRLKWYRRRVPTIVWFDIAASTGTPYFDVLPYVDLYAKSQLLKDRLQYTKPIYNNRIHCDYYHKQYNITDELEA